MRFSLLELTCYLYIYFTDTDKVAVVTRNKKATLFADFDFTTSTQIDNFFQFIDCSEASPDVLARDVRSGVIPIHYSRVVIAIGNTAPMDRFVNVCRPINLLINALVERMGCFRLKLWVLGLLPRPCQDESQRQIMIRVNKGIRKSVEALARKKNFPVQYLAAQKWLLKRVEQEGGIRRMTPDTSMYQYGTNHLNDVGLKHLYLLLAKDLRLREIHYEWEGPPVVYEKAGRQVFLGLDGRQVAKRRAAQMECRDDPPEKRVPPRGSRHPKKRRSTKERIGRRRSREAGREVKSVVVKIAEKEEGECNSEEPDGDEDADQSIPLLVQIPGLFEDNE